MTGISDFGLCVPVQRRYGPKALATVANMSSLLWLRLRPAAGLSAAEAISACREAVEAGLANSDVSVIDIIQLLMSELGSAAPMPETVFVMQDNPVADVAFPGVEAVPLDVDWVNPVGELVAEITPNAPKPGATLRFQYQTRFVAEEQVSELGQTFVTVLTELSG
jgi:hypothetical protein